VRYTQAENALGVLRHRLSPPLPDVSVDRGGTQNLATAGLLPSIRSLPNACRAAAMEMGGLLARSLFDVHSNSRGELVITGTPAAVDLRGYRLPMWHGTAFFGLSFW